MEEFLIIAKWYLILFGTGLIGLAFTQKIFKGWQDRGYGVAKFAGLMIVGIPLWFLSSLRILPFTQTVILIFFGLLLALSIFLLIRGKFKFNRIMFYEELFFLLIFGIWCMIRSTNAQTEGTEKMMNIAILNSIWRAEYFPIADPWYSGLSMNYYYLGHYLFALIGKMAAIPMSFVYNLALVSIISQTFIGIVSILGQMTGLFKKNWKLGLLLGVLVATWLCFGSNLHFLYTWIDQVIIQGKTFNYWFPDGTRIIPFVIDEFPAYSITLGDLHGHYLGMPFLVMFIALLLVSFNTAIGSRAKVYLNLALSPALFFLYGINTWDFITVNFLFLLLHLYQTLRAKGTLKEKLGYFLLAQGALLLPGIPLILPYFMSFKPPVSGLGIVPFNTERPILPYLQMWGVFLIINIMAAVVLLILLKVRKTRLPKFLQGMVKLDHTSIFALLLTIAALCLILGVEVFYVRDIFEKDNSAYFRTNTVFKFYFSAWIIWGIATGYWIFAIFKGIFSTPYKKAGLLLYSVIGILLVLFVGSVSYIFDAVNDFYPFAETEDGKPVKISELLEGKSIKLYGTLDGMDYIKSRGINDYNIINWLNANVSGQPVIVEAVGEAYSYAARISSNTGLPTIMGWPTHEWQWRNKITEIYERKADVELLYKSTDPKVFAELVDDYKIDYIIVSDLEKKSYDTGVKINLQLFNQFFEPVYRENGTWIFKFRFLDGNTNITITELDLEQQ